MPGLIEPHDDLTGAVQQVSVPHPHSGGDVTSRFFLATRCQRIVFGADACHGAEYWIAGV
jgi:hypothetical protein